MNWQRVPSTEYRSEIEYEVIPLDGSPSFKWIPPQGDEEADLDQQMTHIAAVKKETFDTGCTLIKAAMEGVVLVASFFVPDEYDVVMAGGGKLLKAKKTAELADRVLGVVQKLGSRTQKIAANLPQLQGKQFMIKATTTLIPVGKKGNKKDIDKWDDLSEMGKPIKKSCFLGKFCFVKGTPILMADGTLKAVEKVQIGDSVLSKDEVTGVVAAKNVSHTFVRVAPATLVLTFSNGERIETTDEHPFYVESDGFQPAGLLAIGNSIVTRAGPSLTVTGITKKTEKKTVYNFSVADFHTYFVGKSGLWTHNMDCEEMWAQLENYANSTGMFEGTVAALYVPGYNQLFFGRSSAGLPGWDSMIDDEVKNLYAQVPERYREAEGRHGKCAEVHALSQLAAVRHQEGKTLANLPAPLPLTPMSLSVLIRRDPMTNIPKSLHLTGQGMCTSCREVMGEDGRSGLGFVDLGSILNLVLREDPTKKKPWM